MKIIVVNPTQHVQEVTLGQWQCGAMQPTIKVVQRRYLDRKHWA